MIIKIHRFRKYNDILGPINLFITIRKYILFLYVIVIKGHQGVQFTAPNITSLVYTYLEKYAIETAFA